LLSVGYFSAMMIVVNSQEEEKEDLSQDRDVLFSINVRSGKDQLAEPVLGSISIQSQNDLNAVQDFESECVNQLQISRLDSGTLDGAILSFDVYLKPDSPRFEEAEAILNQNNEFFRMNYLYDDEKKKYRIFIYIPKESVEWKQFFRVYNDMNKLFENTRFDFKFNKDNIYLDWTSSIKGGNIDIFTPGFSIIESKYSLIIDTVPFLEAINNRIRNSNSEELSCKTLHMVELIDQKCLPKLDIKLKLPQMLPNSLIVVNSTFQDFLMFFHNPTVPIESNC